MVGYEPLQVALRQRLEQKLPAALAAISAEFPDTVYVPAPAAYRYTATAEEAEYPVVFILPGEATTREQTGGWLTAVREILVVVEHREENVERLGTSLVRYERALMESALAKQAPAPAHGIRWISTTPGPVFELENQPVLWQSWMQLTFELTVYEEDRIT